MPRSFEERLAEDMLDEGLSLENPTRGVRGVGSENETLVLSCEIQFDGALKVRM